MEAKVWIDCPVARCQGGYAWSDAKQTDWRGRFLLPAGSGHATKTWRPLVEETALFRVFAGLELTEDAIVQFANRYGNLTGQLQLGTLTTDAVDRRAGARSWGDRWDDWVEPVLAMRHWLRLWDLAGEGKGKAIADYLESLPNDRNDLLGALRASCGPLDRSWPGTPLKDSQRVSAAKEVAQRAIAGNIEQCADSLQALRLGFAVDERIGQRRLVVRGTPYSEEIMALLPVLWLQFAVATAEGKQFRYCQTCGKPFELTPDLNRTSRFYCKTACKLRAFRERKREAQRMHDKGRTLKQIAEALGSDVSTIRGWLKEGKK